jgi:hypothetical protein
LGVTPRALFVQKIEASAPPAHIGAPLRTARTAFRRGTSNLYPDAGNAVGRAALSRGCARTPVKVALAKPQTRPDCRSRSRGRPCRERAHPSGRSQTKKSARRFRTHAPGHVDTRARTAQAATTPSCCRMPSPARTSWLEPWKSSPTSSQRPPKWQCRNASVIALNASRFSGRAKPWPSSGNTT